MEEAEVVYLWSSKLWKTIRFLDCLILSKTKNFSKWNLEQKVDFYNCDFKGELSQNIEKRDFISKTFGAISDIWMLSKYFYDDETTLWIINMLDYLCITKNTRSL